MSNSKVSPLDRIAEQFRQSSEEAVLRQKEDQAAHMVGKILADGEECETRMGVKVLSQIGAVHQQLAVFDFENRSYAVLLGAEDKAHELLFKETATIEDVWEGIAVDTFVFQVDSPPIFLGNLQRVLCEDKQAFHDKIGTAFALLLPDRLRKIFSPKWEERPFQIHFKF